VAAVSEQSVGIGPESWPQSALDSGVHGDATAFPFRWLALLVAALAILATYYETDVIGEIADMLVRQRGFTQGQIGNLNAAMYWPNVVLALVGGVMIDRYGAARVALWTAAIGVVGAVLTAIGSPYWLMWLGRLIFGVAEGSIFIALVAGLALWFGRGGMALATGVFLSLARVGSFLCNTSSTWARPLYDAGWQLPLWLGAGITLLGLAAAIVFHALETRRPVVPAALAAAGATPPRGRARLRFDAAFWYILGLHVLYAAVFFPFRQTYAVEYFQHAKHLTLQAAGQVNSGVFAAAIFATPLFGLLADRFGNRTMILVFGTLLLPLTLAVLGLTELNPWISTVLMGISWGGDLAGDHDDRAARTPGYRAGPDHADPVAGDRAVKPGRRNAGRPRGGRAAASAGLRRDPAVFRRDQPCRSGLCRLAVAARNRAAWPWPRTRPATTDQIASARQIGILNDGLEQLVEPGADVGIGGNGDEQIRTVGVLRGTALQGRRDIGHDIARGCVETGVGGVVDRAWIILGIQDRDARVVGVCSLDLRT
jgi:MFS family permease